MANAPLKVICGREIQKSLKESSYAEIRDEVYRQGYGHRFTFRESRGEIVSDTGGRAVFIGLKDHTVDSIKSYYGFHWAWLEEAHSISKRSLDVLIPTLRIDGHFEIDFGSDYKFVFPLRMFMYTLNPYHWDDDINRVLPETRKDVQYITINYYDNPWFPKSLDDERKEAKKVMSEEEYDRIWRGIPYEDNENVVVPRSKFLSAVNRDIEDDGGIVVGADIARFGMDKTVFYKRQGLKIVDSMILVKKDTQTVAKHLFDFAEGGRIMVDDSGLGGGVTDRLKEMGENVVPINFGARAKNKKKYPDIISEMWFNLKDMIETISLPDDPELTAEITNRYFKYTPDERRKVESKEEYKKRTGRRSPDKADALILCFYTRTREIKVLR
jgi:phage terminase large subunit